jgi:hypothetical protein
MTQKSRNESGYATLSTTCRNKEPKTSLEGSCSLRLGTSNGSIPTVNDAAKITNYVSTHALKAQFVYSPTQSERSERHVG